MARPKRENDNELEDWAKMAKLAQTSWTKDNPCREDDSANVYIPELRKNGTS